MTTSPTPPIELTGHASHFHGEGVHLDDDFVAALSAICEVVTDDAAVAEASRDWWPLALHWSIDGEVPPSRAPRAGTARVGLLWWRPCYRFPADWPQR